MLVPQRRMMMAVGVGLAWRITRAMVLPVVFFMDMAVFMVQRLMLVVMAMAFRQMKIDADAHQQGGPA